MIEKETPEVKGKELGYMGNSVATRGVDTLYATAVKHKTDSALTPTVKTKVLPFRSDDMPPIFIYQLKKQP